MDSRGGGGGPQADPGCWLIPRAYALPPARHPAVRRVNLFEPLRRAKPEKGHRAARRQALHQAILDAMVPGGQATIHALLAAAEGLVSQDTIYSQLAIMIARGEIERVERGVYARAGATSPP